MEHIIDAKGKSLGRVASEAAKFLLGKNDPKYKPNEVFDIKVTIINTDGLKLTGDKANQKVYKRYSGYPGGLKEEVLKNVVAKKGNSHILRIAVMGMLPKNKLRKRMIKNLILK